jgi:hypothetical protein
VGLDGAGDNLGPATLAQNLRAGEGMSLERGVLLEVEIVEHAGDAPDVLVLASLAREIEHDRFDGEAVLTQAFALCVLAEQVPGILPIHARSSFAVICLSELPLRVSTALAVRHQCIRLVNRWSIAITYRRWKAVGAGRRLVLQGLVSTCWSGLPGARTYTDAMRAWRTSPRCRSGKTVTSGWSAASSVPDPAYRDDYQAGRALMEREGRIATDESASPTLVAAEG